MANPLVMRRLATILTLCAAGTAATGATYARQSEAQSRNQQRVFVSVVDRKGEPVATLAPADLTIREDGKAREVLKVEPATGPMEIALLVDTSTATSRAIPDLRAALKAFGAAIWAKSPDTQIALYSFGDRPMLMADFSSSAVALNSQIDRLFAGSESGAYFIDAVIEASAELRRRKGARPVLVAFVDENGPEFSNRNRDHAFEAVAAARGSLWTVARQGSNDGMSSSENRERAMVIGDVTTRTGGRSATVVGTQGLKTQFTNIAAQLLSQFVVTYGRAESLVPPEQLEIKLTNSNLRLAAPRWTTR